MKDDWELVSISGGSNFSLTAGAPRILGRSADCDFPVYDPSISRRHAELSLTDGGVLLRDLGSANGILVNGARVQEHTAAAGDTLSFGGISFRLVRAGEKDEEPPAAPAPLGTEPAPTTPHVAPTPAREERPPVAPPRPAESPPPLRQDETIALPQSTAFAGEKNAAFASAEYCPVAVLVAQLAGFGELTGQAPAGAAAGVLAAFYARLSAIILEHGGSIHDVCGSSLAAVWGAPVTSGATGTPANDAERALQAAQAIRSDPLYGRQDGATPDGTRSPAAIGLEHGKALVGSLKLRGREEPIVAGRPFEIASRLAAAAAAGEILMGNGFSHALSQPPGLEPAGARELGDLPAWRLMS